jgi:phosphoglycerate dehydrogenase-like enzyme
LEMNVLAWSQNLTDEQAAAAGATYVSKDQLLKASDVVSLHLVLSERTRNIIAKPDLELMKPGAILINTSRGPLIDEAALVEALHARRIVAALDVYDLEPLPVDHPLRTCPNTILTPHLGYVTTETYELFYRDGIKNVLAFLAGAPIRMLPSS